MDEKYKEFMKEFEALCEKYSNEDFDGKELVEVCKDVVENFC